MKSYKVGQLIACFEDDKLFIVLEAKCGLGSDNGVYRLYHLRSNNTNLYYLDDSYYSKALTD